MVSLLIVSHSALIAAGVRELIAQVVGDDVRLAAMGGTADDALGVSVERILGCLRQLDTPDGTLVLVDLGSALLGVDAAVELFGHARVVVSDAPLVEGAYLAALAAVGGAPLAEVAAAAMQAFQMVKVPRGP